MKPGLPYQILARRKFALQASILVAGVSTMAVPGVVMAERHIFGQDPIARRLTVMTIVAVAYTASYVIVRIKLLIAASASFVVTTTLAMTLISAIFAILVTIFSGWSEPSLKVLYVRYFLAFVVVANATFLAMAVRYAIAARKEVTIVGALLGIVAASVCPECLIGSAASLISLWGLCVRFDICDTAAHHDEHASASQAIFFLWSGRDRMAAGDIPRHAFRSLSLAI